MRAFARIRPRVADRSFPLSFLLAFACVSNSVSASNQGAPAPDAGRQDFRCCSRPDVAEGFELTLAAQDALGRGDSAGVQQALDAARPVLTELGETYREPHFVALAEAATSCSGDGCAEVVGAVIDAWIPYVSRSKVGERDAALAWDGSVGRHFFVVGPHLASPYGGGAEDVRWGR